MQNTKHHTEKSIPKVMIGNIGHIIEYNHERREVTAQNRFIAAHISGGFTHRRGGGCKVTVFKFQKE